MEKRGKARLLALLAVAAALALFFALGLHRRFSLAEAAALRERFALLYAQRPLAVIAGYAGIYVAVTALSLPGAAVLTLLGGGIFGLPVGVLVVSFSSSAGALAACAVSRFILRDFVTRRLGPRLEAVNRGLEREGAFYLFGLRLVPLFPFWLVNLAMGLTRMPLRTYYWVSQAGMLPATVVFVNAGRELSRLTSTSGLLSPGLVFSFVLLGLMPLAAKKTLEWLRKKRNASSSVDGSG